MSWFAAKLPELHGLLAVTVTVLALTMYGCRDLSGNDIARQPPVDVKRLVAEAQSTFEKLVAEGHSRPEATQKVAVKLRGEPGVRAVEVTGSDTLMVTFANGQPLVVMLGKDRL